jgi:site-specific recombinase XerD
VNSFLRGSVHKVDISLKKPCSFGQDLARLQQQLGLDTRPMSALLGISASQLSYLKRGLRQPSAAALKGMLAVLHGKISAEKGNVLCPDGIYTCMDSKTGTRLRALLQDFLTAKQVAGASPATLRFYGENLRRFLWWWQRQGLPGDERALDAPRLRAFLHYVQTTSYRWHTGSTSSRRLPTMATVDAYWRSLQGFLAWLVSEEVIPREANPLRKIPRPKVPRKVVQDIPLHQIRRALNLWDPRAPVGARNRSIILMLLDTGMRLSECASLTLEDVDLVNGTVRVWGKGGKQRLARLGKTARGELQAYLGLRGSTAANALWLGKTGRPLKRSGLQIMVRRLGKLGGSARWSPHTFRNTFAMNYLRAGGDPFTLQILGGWEDLEMPKHYCSALKVEDAFAVHAKASPADHLAREPLP